MYATIGRPDRSFGARFCYLLPLMCSCVPCSGSFRCAGPVSTARLRWVYLLTLSSYLSRILFCQSGNDEINCAVLRRLYPVVRRTTVQKVSILFAGSRTWDTAKIAAKSLANLTSYWMSRERRYNLVLSLNALECRNFKQNKIFLLCIEMITVVLHGWNGANGANGGAHLSRKTSDSLSSYGFRLILVKEKQN